MEKKTKNGKKGRKIALLSLYLLYLYHVKKSRGTRPLQHPAVYAHGQYSLQAIH